MKSSITHNFFYYFMYESKNQPVIPHPTFLKRLLRNFIIGFLVTAFSLFIGMLGYSHYEKMGWIDAYVNAAMILSGMGPLGELKTDAGKLFAGTYALFSGIVFLVIVGIIFIPIFHRLFHQFHIDERK